ncbi:MAG: translational GTPase TypA, partial [Candidatus Peribacteraceae bacterium]|nr:translational GTPase TypA [Candidatus Peribacteraceae bacterium]
VDVPETFTGTVIDMLAKRKGEMVDMKTHEGNTRLEYKVPTRGLLGFRGEFIIETRGEGILTHSFIAYEPHKGVLPGKTRGSMISMENGISVAYALWGLQERGRLFITPQTKIYSGMVIGESAKGEDMTVNPMKEKKLTNVRASGSDDAIVLIPVQPLTLEQALEYIAEDELVEVTPTSIRLRKKCLSEHERRRSRRKE